MNLNGKIAVVFGGSQGIGSAVAARLSGEGADIAVIGSTSHAKAEAVADAIRSKGGKAFADICDVRDYDAVLALFERTVKAKGKVDILVNCAGVFYPTPAGDTSQSDLDRMVDINLKGTFHAITAAVPHMKTGGGGRIVNVSSCAGVMGLGRYAVYCATKAAIVMMTRALAIELAPSNININAIAPGNTATPINEDIRTSAEHADFLDAMAKRTPSGRTYSSPEDMAGLVAFLVSDAARAMHGSTVLMDEGFSAGL